MQLKKYFERSKYKIVYIVISSTLLHHYKRTLKKKLKFINVCFLKKLPELWIVNPEKPEFIDWTGAADRGHRGRC